MRQIKDGNRLGLNRDQPQPAPIREGFDSGLGSSGRVWFLDSDWVEFGLQLWVIHSTPLFFHLLSNFYKQNLTSKSGSEQVTFF